MPNRSIHSIIQDQTLLLAPPDITVREAAQRMAEARVGAVMVVQEERLAGIFTERDALNRVLAKGLNPETTLLAQVMTAEPRSVTPDRSLAYALHLMHIGGYRHMPVTEDGRPVGMVSVRDALGQELVQFEKELEGCEKIAVVL